MNLVCIRPSLLLLAAACASVVALMIPRPAAAQSLLDGYWQLLLDEDAPEYGAGPDEGDYGGLPITPAARLAAHTWDPELISLPELQCEPFPSTYGPRAVTLMHIWEDRDPFTQQQTQLETWVEWQSQHRHIWMDGRPHPPPWAQSSWQGFSTGKWVGNVLHVHTDMLKPYFVARNGLPLDNKATMDERFFRYGDVLTDFMIISDPQYLSRPVIESKNYYRLPQGFMEAYPCRPNDEVPRARGIVPMRLPSDYGTPNYGPVSHGVPLRAAEGGSETMFPEYQDAMKTLPPNPALSLIEKAEQKALHEQEGK